MPQRGFIVTVDDPELQVIEIVTIMLNERPEAAPRVLAYLTDRYKEK